MWMMAKSLKKKKRNHVPDSAKVEAVKIKNNWKSEATKWPNVRTHAVVGLI